MIVGRIKEEDASLIIRALFTEMGKLDFLKRERDYQQAAALVAKFRDAMGLVPMSEEHMRAHAMHMFSV
jgi:hypothetical protein